MKSRVAVQQVDEASSPVGDAPRLRLVRVAAERAPAGPSARWVGRIADRLMCRSSLVPTAPLLDVRDFAWTFELRRHWRSIDEEVRGCPGGTAVNGVDHPVTAGLLACIPDLHAARLESLPPGAHPVLPDRRGRALLTCHLGLVVPRGGDLRMRLGERVVRWAQGETLLFDATQAQAWWNDGVEPGLVLSVQLRRPMCQPGHWLADRLLRRARA